MAQVHHPFAVDGSGMMLGHQVTWQVQHQLRGVLFRYRNCAFFLGDQELLQQGYGGVAKKIHEIDRRMASPGIISSNQLGGLGNGVSGQATQAVSGHSHQAFAGGGAAGTYYGGGGGGAGGGGTYIASQGYVGTPISQACAAPLKSEGFKCGEILAYRGWRVTKQGFLRSMSADVVWGPGEPMEGKTKSRSEHNGVYAYKLLRDFLKQHSGDLDVYGKVALWGDVIEHELGYRAEFAKIISLENFCGRDRDHGYSLPKLREIYGLQ